MSAAKSSAFDGISTLTVILGIISLSAGLDCPTQIFLAEDFRNATGKLKNYPALRKKNELF
jgi:hypothetical protein